MKKAYLFLISIMAILITVLFLKVTGIRTTLDHYFDMISFASLMVLCIPLLISAGLMGDFLNAFKYMLKDNGGENLHKLKRSVEAVSFVQKSVLYGAAFISTFQLVNMLYNFNDPSSIGPSVAWSLLSILYGVTINILLIPVKSGLNIKMLEIMEQNNEEN